MIKGTVSVAMNNEYGFLRLNVNNVWYGSDKKGKTTVGKGDTVEFEAFKNTRGYDTFKLDSLKKIEGEVVNPTAVGGTKAARPAGGGREDYWTQKGRDDAAKEPRIAYFAAIERAIQFVDLALRNGAVAALEKAKPTAKLDVLVALVGEQTQRILAESYAQKVPTAAPAAEGAEAPANTAEGEGEGQWS